MTPTEITTAARPIRQILAGQLSLCKAVYAPTDDKADTERMRLALEAFDRIVQAATLQAGQQKEEAE